MKTHCEKFLLKRDLDHRPPDRQADMKTATTLATPAKGKTLFSKVTRSKPDKWQPHKKTISFKTPKGSIRSLSNKNDFVKISFLSQWNL